LRKGTRTPEKMKIDSDEEFGFGMLLVEEKITLAEIKIRKEIEINDKVRRFLKRRGDREFNKRITRYRRGTGSEERKVENMQNSFPDIIFASP
jgi:hypothetical protein